MNKIKSNGTEKYGTFSPIYYVAFSSYTPSFLQYMQTLQHYNQETSKNEEYNGKEYGWMGRSLSITLTNNCIACRDEWKNSAQEDANLLL